MWHNTRDSVGEKRETRAELRLSRPPMPTHSLSVLRCMTAAYHCTCLIQGCAHVQRLARPPPACKRSTATTTTRCSRMRGTSWWSSTSTPSGKGWSRGRLVEVTRLGGDRSIVEHVYHTYVGSMAGEEHSFSHEGPRLGGGKMMVIAFYAECLAVLDSC